jgi:16S rRNA G966 N2-methylase RsmD
LLNHGFENKIDLVYIDPPFLSGERYLYRVENYSNLAFEDVLKESQYLEMMQERLREIRMYFHSLRLACQSLHQGNNGSDIWF